MTRLHQPVAENVLLADDGEPRRLEPLLERDHRQRQRARPRGLRLRPGRDEFQRFQPVLGQHVAQPFARAVAPAGDDRLEPALAEVPDVGDRGVEHVGGLGLPLGREGAADPPAAIDDRHGARRVVEGREPRERAGLSRSFHSSPARSRRAGGSGL